MCVANHMHHGPCRSVWETCCVDRLYSKGPLVETSYDGVLNGSSTRGAMFSLPLSCRHLYKILTKHGL